MDNGASSYRRFLSGDENGLAEIILAYRDGLILYLHSFTGDLRLAEELAEDTFVLLGTKKPRDKGTGSFKTWLYTIGRNLALNTLRRQKRNPEVSLELCPEVSSEEAALEQAYLRQEQKITVHRALHKLKAEYRQVLWLVYFEGMSLKEAASVLKKRIHTVEVLVSRARKALKTQLEKEGFFYEEL